MALPLINSTFPSQTTLREHNHLPKRTVQHANKSNQKRRMKRERKVSTGNTKKCCPKCMHDLSPLDMDDNENGFLPAISTENIYLTGRCIDKQDTFIHVIDSLNRANHVAYSGHNSETSACFHSNYSLPRLSSSDTSFDSESFDSVESDYSQSLSRLHHNTNTVTIISEVPPAPNTLHVPLEELLDYGEGVQRVTIRCSKYDEIGNPQARKKKHLKRGLSANKKWNRTLSYANTSTVHNSNNKEKLNFMDTQLNSIYNSSEKAKMDEQVSPRRNRMQMNIKTVLPQLNTNKDKGVHLTEDSRAKTNPAERLLLNTMMRTKKAAKFECKIPTIPLSLASKAKVTSF